MFAGKVAFVTGASRGVGKAIALTLARNGCDVVVAAKTVAPDARLPGTIGETAREVEALGRRALPLALDGRVDFLVNNAGALYWQSLADTPLKKFDLVMDVNVRGAFACAHHVLPAMRAQKFGHILMMSPPVDAGAAAGKVAYS